MRVIRKSLRGSFSRSEPLRIAFLGDLHVGSKNADLDRFLQAVDTVKEYDAYWIGMGDWADAIVPSPSERRFDMDVVDERFLKPEYQYRWVEEALKPIARKGLVILTGNHDEVLRKRHYHDWVDDLAYRLKVPYGTYSSFLRLVLRKTGTSVRKLDFYIHHGHFSGSTAGGGLNKLLKMSSIMEADIYAMGHIHRKMFTTDSILYVNDALEIVERKRYYVATGGFLKGYHTPKGSYVERKMLAPLELGAIMLEIRLKGNDRVPDVTVIDI